MSSETKAANPKKKEGFLKRQAKSKGGEVTEEELLKKDVVTPDDCLRLNKCADSK
jgi:hypothetical protein